jgi:hypothetical protein
MGEKKTAYRGLAGKPERGHREDQDLGGRIILKFMLEK